MGERRDRERKRGREGEKREKGRKEEGEGGVVCD